MAGLPPGFKIDAEPSAPANGGVPQGFALDPIPQGFTLDQPANDAGGPNLPTRLMASFNEGLIPDTLGLPVDLVNMGMKAVGLPVSDKPFGGSESIRSGMHALGVGKVSPAYDPQSTPEAYGQSITRGIGQAVIPTAGTIGIGGRLLTSAAPVALRSANPVVRGLRTLATGAAQDPGAAAIAETAAGTGAGIGGQYARDTFPGNPYADAAGQILGGFGGGMGAARRAALPERVVKGAEQGGESAQDEALNNIAPAPVAGGPPAPAAGPAAGPDVIRFKDAADLASFRSSVYPDQAALSDADFLDWFGKSRSDPTIAVVGNDTPPAIGMDQEGASPASISAPVSSDAAAADGFVLDDAPDGAGPPASEVPGGFVIDGPAEPTLRDAGMAQEGMSASATSAPVADDPSAPPQGFVLDDPALSRRPTPMMDRPSPDQIAAVAQGTDPRSLLPIPNNEIGSLDEALTANPGSRQLVPTPDERQALPSYTINGVRRRDPMDLVSWLRTQGGIRDEGGKLVDGVRQGTLLQRLGVDNGPRDLEFTKSERFLGKLVRDEGMPLDDAALRAWESGYFPDHHERPDINDFLDALEATHKGGSGRVFHPDDYEAIDAYRAAQRSRNDIERAQQEGGPYYQQIGQPVSLADLEANQPPATAYEDLPAIGGKVGNIDVSRLGSKEDIARALRTVDNRFGGFDAARRGRVAQAETQALASELNMTPDDLLKRRRGQALNAEQALAARAILAKSGDELVKLAKAAQGGSDEALAAFRTGLVRHAAIQEQVSGATAEAGRALAQFRMEAPGSLARGRMLKSILDSGGGREKLEDVAQKIIDLEKQPAAANKFARDVVKPGFGNMIQEYWINAILSGPRTHATNIASNLLTALWSLPEHALTATIGKATGSVDRMTYRDVGARAIGMMEGARDGLKLAARSFATGEPIDGATKVESQEHRAIPGKLGSFIRIPTRALTAEDEFFKSIAYRGELNALAAREALMRGKGPADRARIFQELRDNPTEVMIDRAVKEAQYQTFQQPLGRVGQAAQTISNATIAGLPLGKFFLPFVRTPLNLLKWAGERSPAAPLMSEFRDAIKAGGMARDQAIARVSMGSGMAALAVSWALQGKLSGSGPVDPREREALVNTGWQPFSVKVGDRWYSYQRLDPFARILSTAADFATFNDYMTEKERQDIARTLSIAIARNVSTMPTLDPASNAFQALSDPDRYLARYATNMAASATVPNIVTQVNSTIDPYMRETDTLMDTIKSRVPVVSQRLPARLNMWGQPIQRGDALGPDLLSPIYTSRMKGDKTLDEVSRLRMGLSMPDRKIGDTRLTPQQYAGLVQSSGQPSKAMLDQLTASPRWDGLPDGIRRLIIQRVMEENRRRASMQMLMSNPDLLRAKVMSRVQRRLGER